MKKIETLVVLLPLLVAALAPIKIQAQTPLIQRINYVWDHDLTIGETQLHLRIYIPTILAVQGLQDTVRPGEKIDLEVAITPEEGARIDVSDHSYPLDEVLSLAAARHPQLDLTAIPTLTPSLLSRIIQAQLQLDPQAASELAEILSEHTQLMISSDLEVQTLIEGPAAVTPKTSTTWFTETLREKMEVSPLAKDGDTVNISFKPSLTLALHLDLAPRIYEDPSFGPLMKRLSNMIGLPLNRNLGVITGDTRLEHILTVQTASKLLPTSWIYLIVGVAAVIALALILAILRPKKPPWQ